MKPGAGLMKLFKFNIGIVHDVEHDLEMQGA